MSSFGVQKKVASSTCSLIFSDMLTGAKMRLPVFLDKPASSMMISWRLARVVYRDQVYGTYELIHEIPNLIKNIFWRKIGHLLLRQLKGSTFCIPNAWVIKEFFYLFRRLLQMPQMGNGLLPNRFFCAGNISIISMHRKFQIVVQVLIRIQFR